VTHKTASFDSWHAGTTHAAVLPDSSAGLEPAWQRRAGLCSTLAHPASAALSWTRNAHSVAPRQALQAQHELPAPGPAGGAAHSCADPASLPPGSVADGRPMPLLPAGAHAAAPARASSLDSALPLLQPHAGAPAQPAGLLHAWSVRGALREASGDELFAGEGAQRPARHISQGVSQRTRERHVML